MKTNMCVTIDEEIHSWLKRQPEKLSRTVNRVLRHAMFADLRSRAVKSGHQMSLPLLECPNCLAQGRGNDRGCACLVDMVIVNEA